MSQATCAATSASNAVKRPSATTDYRVTLTATYMVVENHGSHLTMPISLFLDSGQSARCGFDVPVGGSAEIFYVGYLSRPFRVVN